MKKKSGFTLVEVMVVIAIIGILATIVLTGMLSSRAKGRDAKRVSDLKTLQLAFDVYYAENRTYPVASGCGAGTDLWSSWGCWSTLLPSSYISSVPKDPQNTDLGNCGSTLNCHVFHYCTYNNNQAYTLAVNLEKSPPPSPSSAAALSSCPTGGPNTYWVSS